MIKTAAHTTFDAQRHAQACQTAFEQRLLSQKPLFCMGSLPLFLAQYQLAANGFACHEEWQQARRRERSCQFFVLGSKDEDADCQGCVILPQGDGLFTLRLRLPDAFRDTFGEYCHVTDVAFGHDLHWLEQAIAANQLRKLKQAEYRQLDGDKPRESEYLAAFGQAISYRFVRDEKRGWRVLVTTERTGPAVTSERKNGAIGIDLNNHHLAVTEIDARGNKVGASDLVFRTDEDISGPQTTTRLQLAAVELVEQAKASGKPLVIDNLDFRLKKSQLKTRSKADADLNKVVSALAYRQFRTVIQTRAFRNRAR